MTTTAPRDTAAIVPPGPEDREGWGRLWSGYCAFYAVPDTPEKAATVWSWLMDPDHPVKAFVARNADGALMGLTHYRAHHRPLAGAVGCFLDDLFVAPEGRGAGLGEALIARVVEEARSQGWGIVRWITAQDNVRARAVYDRIAARTGWVIYEVQTLEPARGRPTS